MADDERQRERERRRKERELERLKEEEEFERERLKRLAEVEERRKKREEERLAIGLPATTSPSTPSAMSPTPTPAYSPSTSASTTVPTTAPAASRPSAVDTDLDLDAEMMAEIEAQVLAEMEAELEAQAALELELEADKLLAELEKTSISKPSYSSRPAGTSYSAAKSSGASYQPPLATVSRPPSVTPGGSGVCEESLVNKKNDRKAWLESLMKGEKEEQRKLNIQERHREINRNFARKETEAARQKFGGGPVKKETSTPDVADLLGDEDDEEWANNLLKELESEKP